jgi:hypothetical protein
MKKILALLAVTTAFPALAQSTDVVVMRRSIAPPVKKVVAPTPTPTPTNRTCGSFTTRVYGPATRNLYFWAGPSTMDSSVTDIARKTCEEASGTFSVCAIVGYSNTNCANSGAPVGAGQRCWGVSSANTTSSYNDPTYATASCVGK